MLGDLKRQPRRYDKIVSVLILKIKIIGLNVESAASTFIMNRNHNAFTSLHIEERSAMKSSGYA